MPPIAPRRKIAFVVTEDWFFASHFLPMARAAREMGLDVVVVTRVRDHAGTIEATGARVIPLEAERRNLGPGALASATRKIAAILKAERADIVHCISLRSILVGAAASGLAGIDARVFALTGLGFLGARRDIAGRTARLLLRAAIRGPLQTPRTRYLFENRDDASFLGLDPASPRVAIVGGAGVDPSLFPATAMPRRPPLKIAVVARMLWSKGIDTAVEAVLLARAKGAAVELSLFGRPDPSNPKTISEAQLREWSELDGIAWHDVSKDVGAVWRSHHAACLPSRGGEGLPRTLLEAASCGRAILTTDVPGCRDLVRDGIEGFVVPPDDPRALAAAILRLSGEHDLVPRMGQAARERVLAGYTERHVMDAVKRLYGEILADPARGRR